jgi:integrase
VKSISEYAPGVKRVYVAQVDRSPQANGADFWELWQVVCEKDIFVGMQLLLIMAFGARRKEAVMFMPLICDKGLYVELVSGTKGGKPRAVPIDSESKRQVLDLLKDFVTQKYGYAKAHIGHPDGSLAQNLKRYSYVLGACGMTKDDLGFTGHSLRQEYVNDQLEKRGIVPTIRGGSGRGESRLETDVAYLQVSGQAGHGRKLVVTAYSGAMRVKKAGSSEIPEDN